MLIDSHVHLPLVEKDATFRDSTLRLLRDMEENGIEHVILIPDNETASKIGDLDTCLEHTQNEHKISVMGTLDILRDKKPLYDKLDSLFGKEEIVGVKIFPGWDPFYPTDRRLFPVYDLCVRYDLPLMIHAGYFPSNPRNEGRYNDPKHIVRIAKKFPDLKIIISHYYFPRVEYCFEMTVDFGNIYYDTSGLADRDVINVTGKEKIKRVLAHTISRKPGHLLFGSDYACCRIRDHLELIDSLGLGLGERNKVLFENAIKVFKLKPELWG